MSQSVYDLAKVAAGALRPVPKPRTRVRVVTFDCPICQRTHRMALGEPRCTAPVPTASRCNPAFESIFGRA